MRRSGRPEFDLEKVRGRCRNPIEPSDALVQPGISRAGNRPRGATMRYLTMIKTDESMPAGPPPPALFAAIGELGEQATKDGTILETGGLLPSAAGALV